MALTVNKKNSVHDTSKMWSAIKEYDVFNDILDYIIKHGEIKFKWESHKMVEYPYFNKDFVLRFDVSKGEVVTNADFGRTFIPIEINLNRYKKDEVVSSILSILQAYKSNKYILDDMFYKSTEDNLRVLSDYINKSLLNKFKKSFKNYEYIASMGIIPDPTNSNYGFEKHNIPNTFSEFIFDDYKNDTIIMHILYNNIYYNCCSESIDSLGLRNRLVSFINVGCVENISRYHLINLSKWLISYQYSDKLLSIFLNRILDTNSENMIHSVIKFFSSEKSSIKNKTQLINYITTENKEKVYIQLIKMYKHYKLDILDLIGYFNIENIRYCSHSKLDNFISLKMAVDTAYNIGDNSTYTIMNIEEMSEYDLIRLITSIKLIDGQLYVGERLFSHIDSKILFTRETANKILDISKKLNSILSEERFVLSTKLICDNVSKMIYCPKDSDVIIEK